MGTLRAEFEVRWNNLQEPLLAGVQKQSEDEEVDPQKHVASLFDQLRKATQLSDVLMDQSLTGSRVPQAPDHRGCAPSSA